MIPDRNVMLKALVHTVSPNLSDCELTYLERTAIDHAQAVAQHNAYCELLTRLGVEVVWLSGNEHLPDATFVEDTAIVFDEVAVIVNMGAQTRKAEVALIEKELMKYRPIACIKHPATLEGGDVVQIGNMVFVGRTQRTNDAGIKALRHILARFDYQVVAVEVHDCLHFKSACTAISTRSLLVNPAWVDISQFSEFNVITVDEAEPWAANTICLNSTVCLHSAFTATADSLRELGFNVATIDISEFLKAEGGLSCLSIRFDVSA